MDKENVMYIHIYVYIYTFTYTMEYYLAIKKNEFMSFAATWMEPEVIVLSEPGVERQL